MPKLLFSQRRPGLGIGLGLATTAAIAAVLFAILFVAPTVGKSAEPLLSALGITSCSSSTACSGGSNSSSGDGVQGSSKGGSGVLGQTTYVSNSSSWRIGVLGQDLSTSGAYDIGVKGSSKRGLGVVGQSISNAGVEGLSSGGDGVFAESNNGAGLVAISDALFVPTIEAKDVGGGDFFDGVNLYNQTVFHVTAFGGISTNGYSIAQDGSITAAKWSVSSGDLQVTGTAAAGDVVSGGDSGVASVGGSFDGEDAGIIGTNMASLTSGKGTGYAVEAMGFGGDLFVAENTHHVLSLDASDNGNLTITGQLFTAGSCSAGCVKRADEPGVHVVRYTPSESQPTIEDFGEGQVTDGSGYVHLDTKFASTIDQTTNYLVFITPEGPSQGVYVAQKSANGFAVLENPGGHSTFAFSWRLIATPYGDSQARLPMVNMTANGDALRANRPKG